ncbi:hypothetical protein K1719_024681 [Acacia pycnantha]|nr:hypothetical protein K1719_024681 [Acacia pycnantha]
MRRRPSAAAFLEGLWPFVPRKFEAITGPVMPLDVPGRTRATPISLQLLVFNEEFLVSASHQLALTTSPPFVHTARRSYRLNGPVKCSDRGDVGGSPPATSREVHRTLSFRGRRSRNKVSVGEPAEGSLSCPRKKSDPRTGWNEHLLYGGEGEGAPEASPQRISRLASMKNVAKCDTWCELRNPVNHRVFERKLRPAASRGHARPGVTQRRQRPILRRGG